MIDAIDPEEDQCPGPDCWFCSGRACLKCLAGILQKSTDDPECDHDVIDRHEPGQDALTILLQKESL